MTIKDIVFTQDFFTDYDAAPRMVKKRLDVLVKHISDTGTYPNSMRIHDLKSTDLSVGYVTTTGAHWRLLFWIEYGKMYFYRVMKHDEYDILIKSLSKGK